MDRERAPRSRPPSGARRRPADPAETPGRTDRAERPKTRAGSRPARPPASRAGRDDTGRSAGKPPARTDGESAGGTWEPLDDAHHAHASEPLTRPLAVSGIVAAIWCAGIGLTTLTTVTLIGWIAAPRAALGTGLPGVFRTAVNFWLVAHHAGFSVPHGRVGLLPLGLTVLPGALLFRGGGWIARTGRLKGRYRVGVVHAALSVAIPYAVLAGLLALLARAAMVQPSIWQTLLACFLLATVAGGLGAARALVSSTTKGSPWAAMLRLLPHRARSLAAGVTGATAVLLGSGLLIFLTSMACHPSEIANIYGVLRAGVVGGVLVSLIALAYLPNAALWAVAYAVGPGFSVGAGTNVSPSGVFIGMIPSFPPFAALPAPGPAPLVSLFALVAPFAAGAVGGVLTVRALPTVVGEAAPLWGFVCGVLTGGVVAALAALSGGPLGGQRMAVMGPSAWQTGLMAALEVGISAAIAAWAANWQLLRRVPAPADPPSRPTAASGRPAARPEEERPVPRAGDRLEFVDPEPVLASVESLPEGVIPLPDRVADPGEGGLPTVPRPRDEPGSVSSLRKKRDRPN